MAEAPSQPIIEADDHDNGSALGEEEEEEEEEALSTVSISSSILKYREENGRTYHSYKDGKYLGPNDEPERDRLDLQHHLFTLTFSNRLHLCPIGQDGKQIHRVLDAGTGTGIWAIDFADEHPEAKVLGIDLSAIQPGFVPPNVSFQVDDLEEAWTFRESEKFDFIYARMMTSSFADWPKFFEQSFGHLVPGGYIELADISFPVQCDDETLTKGSALLKWANLMLEGTIKMGRPINSAKDYKQQLEAAGFVNVVKQKFVWPQNRWPKEQKMKEIGTWCLGNMAPSLEGFSMALFTRVLGWTKEEVEVFLIDVRAEVKDPRIHAYWPIYVVYGQKPS